MALPVVLVCRLWRTCWSWSGNRTLLALSVLESGLYGGLQSRALCHSIYLCTGLFLPGMNGVPAVPVGTAAYTPSLQNVPYIRKRELRFLIYAGGFWQRVFLNPWIVKIIRNLEIFWKSFLQHLSDGFHKICDIWWLMAESVEMRFCSNHSDSPSIIPVIKGCIRIYFFIWDKINIALKC